MTKPSCILLALATVPLFLTACAGIPGESPDHMRERMERQDKVVDRYQEKRQIRSEAADRRYDQWWDKAMGRPAEANSYQQAY